MIWWIDAGAGASGDMLLGALLALDPDGLSAARSAVGRVLAELGSDGAVELATESVRRAGMFATRAIVATTEQAAARTWQDIEPTLQSQPSALAVFSALAEAEAKVHGLPVAEVHFHEVGALDAIADIVAVTALCERLAPDRVVVSGVCVGSGLVHGAHGHLTVPAPAVTELLRGVPTFAGPTPHEACTPTGAALLRWLADEWGPQPAMTVTAVGVGAGGRDTAGQPNVVRILTGDPGRGQHEHLVLVETTVDDLDPRIYPDVMAAAKAAGALESWLTPVIMKHGRPGVVVGCLTPPGAVDAVTSALFRHTTTLGVRRTPVDRVALHRDVLQVEVAGRPLQVKRGWLDGRAVTVQPELRDAEQVARDTGMAVREVLDRARSAAVAQSPGHDAGTGPEKEVRTPPTGETATSEQD